jgi:protein-S-isoprenylcysteine O-methyltransferase Ste14
MTRAERSPIVQVVRWCAASAFVAALLVCLVAYETTMGRSAGQTPHRWRPVLVDVGLFATFALHHSVFARLGVREWVRRVVLPSLERSAYVLVSSLILIAVCLLWQSVAGTVWVVTGLVRVLLRLVQLGGVWLTIRSAASIDVWTLAGVRDTPASDTPATFRSTGPYGWVRHPIYSGWILWVFGEPSMTATCMLFAVVSSAYLLIAIPWEERALRATSRGAYDRYMAQVPWRLVPGVY